MRWADGFIAVDWGTTNRRAYSIAPGGGCIDEFEDDKGILSVAASGFPKAVEEIRRQLGDKPLLLAGMIGSNRGWIEAPYADCPAGLDELACALTWADVDIAIVPGVALRGERFDVMRGEEVQVLGSVESGEIPPDCLVCHPGTHNKWIQMRDSNIHSFLTVMTGELFGLLRKHSILSDSLGGDETFDTPFREGVCLGLSGGALSAELFSVRARVLLKSLEPDHASSFASGLLIGQDVRAGLGEGTGQPVFVMGRPELTALYAKALEEAGTKSLEIDGEGAFIAGACRIAEAIQ